MGVNLPEWINRPMPEKTFIISISAVFITALIFLFGIHFLLNKDSFRTTLKNYIPVTKESKEFKLDLNNPDEDKLVFDGSILVSGKSSAFASIVISTQDKDTGFAVGKTGEFSRIIDLSPGLNYLSVSAFDPAGNVKTENRIIFYSEGLL